MEDGDREGAESAWGRILFLVGQKLLAQGKSVGAHWVEAGVRGPQ